MQIKQFKDIITIFFIFVSELKSKLNNIKECLSKNCINVKCLSEKRDLSEENHEE